MARPRSLLASLALLALVGCTAGPEAVGPRSLEVVYAGDAAGLPMAIALVAFEPSLIVTELEPADVVEFAPGQYVLDTAWFDQDGRTTLELPAAADLPTGLRLPAAEAVRLFDLPAGCTLAVGGTATVSGFAYGPLDRTSPLFVGLDFDTNPVVLMLTEVVDFAVPVDAATLVTFVYADAPVTYTTQGPCTDLDVAYAVDLALERGWNRVGIAVSNAVAADPLGVAIALDPGTGLYAHPVYATP
jgi:hypothetical protein